MVFHAEQAVKKGSDGFETGRRVGDEEHQNHQCRHTGENIFPVSVTPGEKFRKGNSPEPCRVTAQSSCNDKPVEIGTRRKTDSRPAYFRNAAQIRQTG